eukprot:3602237-Pleurochrysis_carterae.AAC.1
MLHIALARTESPLQSIACDMFAAARRVCNTARDAGKEWPPSTREGRRTQSFCSLLRLISRTREELSFNVELNAQLMQNQAAILLDQTHSFATFCS